MKPLPPPSPQRLPPAYRAPGIGEGLVVLVLFAALCAILWLLDAPPWAFFV